MSEPMMWNGMMSGLGWLWVLLWLVLPVALIVLVVLAMVSLSRNLGLGGRPSGGGDSGGAREALDLRYARGDIGRDEYLQARRDLDRRTLSTGAR